MPLKNYTLTLKDTVETFTKKLFYALFDEQYYKENIKIIESLFIEVTQKLQVKESIIIWELYKVRFNEIRVKLDLDAIAFEETDPAAKSLAEVYLAYPGFHAIAVYRLSHELVKLHVPTLPRMMSEYAHGITGTDIHPGATIGNSFFIDHATGIVIGETTLIKENVKIYQGVTLGGIQVKKSLAETKRHPTIENNVTIYANATILGGDVVIGENSIIGANVCVTESVPSESLVIYQSENKIVSIEKNKL
ncbi:serine O-acetyltransferase EpsC [Tenacibaculum retecalamus]|uniref:serine O-acetyltransferase EpsC n=1 Tax=Tenacibaculum retecalamus TaxID=3018315 RepID=UPI0023D96C7B|nr:serine O-acetyltransferase EpsC [Tenacibaculum retecalamus]WBX72205.1 serine O-acetyltransferase [Tenacibaculum retecalamus]